MPYLTQINRILLILKRKALDKLLDIITSLKSGLYYNEIDYF